MKFECDGEVTIVLLSARRGKARLKISVLTEAEGEVDYEQEVSMDVDDIAVIPLEAKVKLCMGEDNNLSEKKIGVWDGGGTLKGE
jgi:hypothetical protein